MSYATYRLLHFFGLMLLFCSLGGLSILGLRSQGDDSKRLRRVLAVGHGLALLILLVSGFGSMARLGIMGDFPGWIWVKLAVWLVFGAALVLLKRMPAFNLAMVFILPMLGAIAAWTAFNKPG